MTRVILLVSAIALALTALGGTALAKPDHGRSDAKGTIAVKPLQSDKIPAAPTKLLAEFPPLADGKFKLPKDSRPGRVGAQSATPRWINGSASSTQCFNPLTNVMEILTTEFVGYWGTDDLSYPRVGDLYYGHVVVAEVGTNGTRVVPEVVLPPHTNFAINPNDPNRKVRCFWENFETGQSGEFAANECPQAPQAGTYGHAFYQPFNNQVYWPLPPGMAISIVFPVITTAELKGITASPADCLMGAIWAADSRRVWDAPEQGDPHCTPGTPDDPDGVWQGVWVPRNSPSISYPDPSATNITATGARTTGVVHNHGVAGTAFIDLGTSTSYGDTISASIPSTGDAFTVYGDWSRLKPATTYHWRLRFVDRQGHTYRGADQTFRTADPPPDTTAPKVTRVIPAANAKDVTPGTNVAAVFSEPMKEGTLDGTSVQLFQKGSTTPVAAAVTYDATAKKVTLNPTANLKRGATYKAVISTAVTDLAGNPLAQPKTWSFTVRR